MNEIYGEVLKRSKTFSQSVSPDYISCKEENIEITQKSDGGLIGIIKIHQWGTSRLFTSECNTIIPWKGHNTVFQLNTQYTSGTQYSSSECITSI